MTNAEGLVTVVSHQPRALLEPEAPGTSVCSLEVLSTMSPADEGPWCGAVHPTGVCRHNSEIGVHE